MDFSYTFIRISLITVFIGAVAPSLTTSLHRKTDNRYKGSAISGERLDKEVKVIDFNKVIKRIRGTEFDDGLICDQIANDVVRLGWRDATHYLLNFSPSKLGTLKLKGLRKLAQIRRDHPEKFRKLIVYLPPEMAERII